MSKVTIRYALMVGKYKASPPRLIAFGNAMRCSACMMPFPPDAKPSREAAFAEHVLKAHQPSELDRELIPFRVARGIAVAGRCSKCHRPFEVPLVVESKSAVDRAHTRLMQQFDQHTCNEDANQALS